MGADSLLGALEAAGEAIASAGHEYALIGGAAMPVWGHLRATRDIDVIVLVGATGGKEAADLLVAQLRRRGFSHQDGVDRRRLQDGWVLFARFLLEPRDVFVRVDIFLASDEFRAGVVRRAVRRRMNGFEVPVASCEDLILLKCLAGRPVDLADARALFAINATTLDGTSLERRAAGLGISGRPWVAPSGP